MIAKSINIPGKLLALILIPCLLYLTYVAGSRGLADIYARPVMIKLGKWEQGKLGLSQPEWLEAQSKLKKALTLDSKNPLLHLWMGLSIEGPYRSYFTDPVEGNIARETAADHYRKSNQLQPTWPYAWTDLAMVKYRSGEIDEEMFQAVQMAMELGPWETPNLSRLIRMAIVVWPDVPDEYKSSFLTVVFHSLQHGKRGYALDTLRLLNRTGILARVSADDANGVIDGIMRFLDNGSPNSVKEMLMMLDKQALWSALSDEHLAILNRNLDRVLVNANPAYVQSVNEILAGSGMGERLGVRSEE
jgi:hypothetical protein